MATYDYYCESKTANISKIGKKMVNYRNTYFMNLVKQFCKSENICILEIGPGKGYFANVCRLNKLYYTVIKANSAVHKFSKEIMCKIFCKRPPSCFGRKF